MMKTLIDHATVLTMDRDMTVITDGYALIEDSRIAKVGEGVYEGTWDRHIDGRDGILMPGMVNTHCHVSMIPFRTLGDDCPDRLRRFLFPLELEAMTPRLVRLSAQYGICEMLLSGITTFLDMYYFEDQVAMACEYMGIRAYLGETIINIKTCDSETPYGGLKLSEAFLDHWKNHPLVTPVVAPHAVNTNSAQILEKAHALAARYDTLFTLHASEMDYEMDYFKDTYKKTPIRYLYDIGVLQGRTLAAHCIHVTEEDMDLMGETQTTVSHCIGSNTKAGKGVAPVPGMEKRGIPVGFGTDGPSSGNTLSLFPQFKLFASFQKTVNHDRSLYPASDIVSIGTIGGARALHADKRIGSIEPGKKADLTLVETKSASMFPCYNPYSALVYAAEASNVDMVMVDGRVLVENGKLLHVDLERLRRELSEEMKGFYDAALKYRDMW